MKTNPVERKILIPLLVVVSAFVFSRFIYERSGVQFQGNAYIGSWQAIDPVLLRTDLLRSVFYLHSQPPLMNLFSGIVLQVFPDDQQDAFHIIFHCAGLILAISLFLLGCFVGLRPWLSAIITTSFMVSPGTVFYEHWLTYTYPLLCTLTLAGVLFHRFVQTNKKLWGFLFFSMLGVIVLTWSLFHLAWYLFFVFLLWFIHHPNNKNLLAAALVPVLVVTGWYIKNLIIFGEFTASSWAGMNLSRITTFRISENEREGLVEAGMLSKFALLPPFRNPLVYLELIPDTPLTGIPVLDRPEISSGGRNHHHLVYIEASHYYLRDALKSIRLKPLVYLRSVGQATYIYFHSSSDYEFLTENRTRFDLLDLWWNRLFYGQWMKDETAAERLGSISSSHIAWLILLTFITAVTGGIVHLWRNRGQVSEPSNLLVLFMSYNILYVSLAGNLMDIGENNRFRYVIDPLLLILFGFILQNGFLPFFNKDGLKRISRRSGSK